MAYPYCGCNVIEATGTTQSETAYTITIIPAQTFIDYKFYTLNLCLSLVARIGTEPVAISDGTTDYPVMDTDGNPVVSGTLRGHHKYRIRYGSGGTLSDGTAIPEHFVVYEGLCPMEYSANAALITPAIAPASAKISK